jgi:hypothetical protein
MRTDHPQYVRDTMLSIIDGMEGDLTGFVKDLGRDFTRRRKLDFATVMLLLLTSGSDSTSLELYRYFDFDVRTPSPSAFCQQRAKIRADAFRYLLEGMNGAFPCTEHLDGYQLIACDGSDSDIARDPLDKRTHYPPSNSSTRGFNMVSIVPLYDILNRRYLDMELMGGRDKNEFRALCDLVDRFEPGTARPLFIADRGFASYNVFAHMVENGVHFLIRAKDKTVERLLGSGPLEDVGFDTQVSRVLTRSTARGRRVRGREDRYRTVSKGVPLDYLGQGLRDEYELSVRVVRFGIGEGAYENIITNLPQDGFGAGRIRDLYALRWEIELSFRDLKHTLGATNFHSSRFEYIEQELWARMILYNVCSIMTSHVVIKRDAGRRHVYKVNFSVAIRICHNFIRLGPDRAPPEVEALIGANLLPVRPGRKYNRQHRFRLPSSFTYRFS